MTPAEAKLHLTQFALRRVTHKNASDALSALMTMALSAEKEKIFVLVGPSKVGKSTVLSRLRMQLIEHHRDEMEQDPSFNPVISVDAVTGTGADFDWKDCFARILASGGEPLIGHKTDVHRLVLDGRTLASTRGLVKSELWRSTTSMIKHRRTKYLILDEASAIIDAEVNRNQRRQFNILKSLCNDFKVVIILSGAYDLMGYRQGNGQLVGRSECVHIRRYGLNEVDVPIFENAAHYLLHQLPVQADAESLLSDIPFVLMKSVGCIGHLRDWLYRAAVEALVDNEGVLTQEIFERHALPNWKVVKLTNEATLGEAAVQDTGEEEVAALYGLTSIRSEPGRQEPATKPPARRGRVGQRGPSRDPIGNAA